jgi:hypothetical protein
MPIKIAPKTGFDGFLDKGLLGKSLLINPISYHPDLESEFGIKNEYAKGPNDKRGGVIADVVVLDGKKTQFHSRQMITFPTVVKNLRPIIGSGNVEVGELAKQAPKGQGNPYWIIKPTTDAEAKAANDWYDANEGKLSEQVTEKPVLAQVIPTQRPAPEAEAVASAEEEDDPFE